MLHRKTLTGQSSAPFPTTSRVSGVPPSLSGAVSSIEYVTPIVRANRSARAEIALSRNRSPSANRRRNKGMSSDRLLASVPTSPLPNPNQANSCPVRGIVGAKKSFTLAKLPLPNSSKRFEIDRATTAIPHPFSRDPGCVTRICGSGKSGAGRLAAVDAPRPSTITPVTARPTAPILTAPPT